MSAFVIALSIPLLPVFGAITVTEAAINARKKGSSLKEELTNILNESDSELIEKFHSETKIIFKQEIDEFLKELTKQNLSEKQLMAIKEELLQNYNEWDTLLEMKLIKKDKILTIYDIKLSDLQKLGEEKFLELKEKINDIKAKLLSEKDSESKQNTKTSISTSNKVEPVIQKENYKNELMYYYNNLINIDNSFKNKYHHLINELNDFSSQRAKLLLDEIKLIYIKRKKELTKTQIYKEELKKLSLKTSNENKKEIEKLLHQKIISKKEYENLFMKITKENILKNKMENQKKLLAQNLTKILKEINYTIIENESKMINNLVNNKRVILPIKDKEYKVVIQLNKNNELLTRFVKIIDSEKNISTSEKLKDKSELKKWCNIQKKVYESLKKTFLINSVKIIEDDESDILYIIDNEKNEQILKKEVNGQNSFRK